MRVIINTRETDKEIYISPSKSHIAFNLPSLHTQVSSVSITTAEIPYSFYQIQSRNNIIKCNEQFITLPIGNYSITSLLNYFNEKSRIAFNTDLWGEMKYNKIQSKFEITMNELNSDINTIEFLGDSAVLFGFTSTPIIYIGPYQIPNPQYIDTSIYVYDIRFNYFDTYISGGSNNNKIKIHRYGNSTGETLTITEPDNYNPYYLVDTLQTLIDQVMPNTLKLHIASHAAYDEERNQYIIYALIVRFLQNDTTSSISYDIKLDLMALSPLFNITTPLVFRNPPPRLPDKLPTVQFIQANQMPQLNSINNIFINCNFIQRGVIVNNKYTKFLCRIPLDNAQPNEMILFKDYNNTQYEINTTLNRIELTLCDYKGNIIDLNGCDWFIELSFQ
jgi:hypothetical protein